MDVKGKKLVLSSIGLERMFKSMKWVEDFAFFVEDHIYRCNSLFADFISPKIYKMRQADPTIFHYNISTKDPNNYFEKIIALYKTGTCNLSDDEMMFCQELGIELQNVEMGCFYLKENMNVDNVLELIGKEVFLTLEPIESAKFAAMNFEKISFENMKKASPEVLSFVLRSDKLLIQNENSLFEKISNLISIDDSYCELLQYIYVEYLSEDNIKDYVQKVDPSIMSFDMWKHISRRLILPCTPQEQIRGRFTSFSNIYEYNSGQPLNGIIRALEKKCGGNPHDKGILSLIPSHGLIRNEDLSKLLDVSFNDRSWSIYSTTTNENILFDFKKYLVKVTSYSIKSHTSDNFGNGNYLNNWYLEGSNNNSNWTRLDTRSNSDLFSYLKIVNYNTSVQQKFRYIRLLQPNTNSSGNYYLAINGIEFFGEIEEVI